MKKKIGVVMGLMESGDSRKFKLFFSTSYQTRKDAVKIAGEIERFLVSRGCEVCATYLSG